MKRKSEKSALCLNCKKLINLDKEKYIILITNNGKEEMERVYFHFNCWTEYFKKCVERKLRQLKDKAFDNVKRMTGVDPSKLMERFL